MLAQRPGQIRSQPPAPQRVIKHRQRREDFTGRMGFEPHRHYPDDYAPGCDGCSAAETASRDHERVLSFLAAPHSDHPDYRDEWRP